MLNLKHYFIPSTLLFVTILGAATANAENPMCYTLASLQGSWGGRTIYGAGTQAESIGQQFIDASGNLNRSYFLNAPVIGDPSGARTISTGTQTGTYTINCDGSGTITRVNTNSSGVVVTQIDNFFITAAEIKNGQFVATALIDAQQTPSALVPGGVFVFRLWTRLADRPGPTQP